MPSSQPPILLIQDTLRFFVYYFGDYVTSVNDYLGLKGIDGVILLVAAMHVLYFVFFWKGSINQKLEN